MKKVLNLVVLVCFLASVAVLHSCKKDPEVPTLTTTAVSSITTNSASSGGNITSDGREEVTARGVCWGTSASPTVSGSHSSDGTGIGVFTSSLINLSPDAEYFVRAYATNSVGTAYGNEVTFTTEPVIGATVTTTAVATYTSTTATMGGEVTADGGAAVTERGVCWGATANPATSGSHLAIGSGIGVFSSNITGLTRGTAYHVRAYAINTSGTSYGNDVSFTTEAIQAIVTTAAVTVYTQTTATMGGTVADNGGAAVTERGVCWGATADPTITGSHLQIGSGDGVFSSNITSLTAGTTYHVRAYATNTKGTAYGDDVSFTTSPIGKATLTTTAPALIPTSSTTATAGGNITADGGGTITERGVCWNTSTLPEVTNFHQAHAAGGTGSFDVTMTGLEEGTIYYVRAYALNSAGYAYGNEFQILTMMSDRDNSIYKTVLITGPQGSQIWMAENLKITKLNDGTDIFKDGLSNTQWAALTEPGSCYYQDDPDNVEAYGALYNWYAINTGNLCPDGWIVPEDADFKTLEMNLGMLQDQADAVYWRGTDEGSEMKTTTGWASDGNGTNSSGFSGLPGGYRNWETGEFAGLGAIGSWGTSTGHTATTYLYRQLWNDHTTVFRQDTGKAAGFSVRCLKD